MRQIIEALEFLAEGYDRELSMYDDSMICHAFAEGDSPHFYVDARIYFGDEIISDDSCGGIDGDLDDYMDGECIVECLLATADAWKTDQLTNHGPYAAEITRRLLRC